jgi:Ca2+-binding EF-hand superfamily protein
MFYHAIIEYGSDYCGTQTITGVVEFDDFLKIVLEHRSTENTPNEIMSAFKLYDTHRHGYIDAKQLRYILTNTGEKLTDKDGEKRKIILINNLFFFFSSGSYLT